MEMRAPSLPQFVVGRALVEKLLEPPFELVHASLHATGGTAAASPGTSSACSTRTPRPSWSRCWSR